MNAVSGKIEMPTAGDTIQIDRLTIIFVQIPNSQGIAVVEGLSGDARRRVELTTK